MSTEQVRVRVEEILIGAACGALVGYSACLPLLLLAGPQRGGWGFFVLRAQSGGVIAGLAHATLWSLGFVGGVIGAWLAARQESEVHLRGTRYIADPGAARDALADIEQPRMSPAQQRGERRGIVIGGVELSRRREVEHAVILGPPGGGKTLGVLRPVLNQALARPGARVIVHDPKGDFTASHYDPAHAVLLGPWDDRAAVWDAAADFANPALVDEFAAGICGVVDSGQNRYFHSGAATILGGLIKSYIRAGSTWTWSMLAADLSGDPISLIQRAATGDALVMQAVPSVWAPSRGKIELTTGERGIISTLGNSSRMLMQLAAVDASRPDAPRFSIRRWLTGDAHHEIRLVLLNNSALYSTAASAIFGGMLAVAKAMVSASMPEKSADDDDGLWLILDEGRQLGAGALEAVQVIEEVGRSRGVRVWLALQDGPQLAAIVGRDKAGPMLAMQSVRVYLRATPESAENLARTVGEREIMRIQSTASSGAVQGKTSTYDRVPVLLPSDLTGLTASRCADGDVLVEMLIAIEDVVGKLTYKANPKIPSIAQAQVPCIAWETGVLPADPVQAQAPTAAGGRSQTVAAEPDAEQFAQPESTPDIEQPAPAADGDPDTFVDLWPAPGNNDNDSPDLDA
ncbi:MAG: type IV secretion system DNA-binding domain-containing protein [Solirubrobacteraceae bacterium]